MPSSIKLTNTHGKTISIVGDDNITQDITYNLSKNMYTVDTVAALRSMTSVPEYVYASGYHTANDGAFGSHFYRLATDTGQVDNSGTIIRTVNGVYELQYDGAVNIKWFGAVGDDWDGTTGTDNTVTFEKAVNYCWENGKELSMPSGVFIGNMVIPKQEVGYEYRGDVFKLTGAGASNGFLGINIHNGTTIKSLTSEPALKYESYITGASANHVYISGIRFEADSNNPVVHFTRFSDFSTIDKFEIRQYGIGDGLKFDHAYGGSISNGHVMNGDLVDNSSTLVRTGIAYNIAITAGFSGGMLSLKKLTARGFLNGYVFGNNTNYILSTLLEQCECSTVTNGITISTNMKKTKIDTCYFEQVFGICVVDKGDGTTVTDCMMFENYTIGIDGNYDTRGNVYINNTFHLNSSSCTAIKVKSLGDATGTVKNIKGNTIYFLSGGTANTFTDVKGIDIYGINPVLYIQGNNFRPIRTWLGGSGTEKITNNYTGNLLGSTTVMNNYESFDAINGVQLSLSSPATEVTDADIVGGVLTLPSGGLLKLRVSTATNITSVICTPEIENRIVVLRMLAAGHTFVKSGSLQLSTPTFTGYGTITFYLTSTYAVEIARSSYTP